jgi:hypothetical protein
MNVEIGKILAEKKPDNTGIQTERILADREQDEMNARTGKNPPVKNLLKNLTKTAVMLTDRKAESAKAAGTTAADARVPGTRAAGTTAVNLREVDVMAAEKL